jgi:hypothetical protein
MPSHCSVASIVFPRIGFALIGVQHQPVRIDAAFSTDAVNQRGRSLGALLVVDLPTHNAPAPHVHHQEETVRG